MYLKLDNNEGYFNYKLLFVGFWTFCLSKKRILQCTLKDEISKITSFFIFITHVVWNFRRAIVMSISTFLIRSLKFKLGQLRDYDSLWYITYKTKVCLKKQRVIFWSWFYFHLTSKKWNYKVFDFYYLDKKSHGDHTCIWA